MRRVGCFAILFVLGCGSSALTDAGSSGRDAVAVLDSGIHPDAAEPDALEPDAAAPDAVEPDAAAPDAAEPDATEPDAAAPDAAEPDATEPDAAVADAGTDGGPADSGPECTADDQACAGGTCCAGVCVQGAACCSDAPCLQSSGPGFVCSSNQCVDVAGSLSGLLWLLPCGASTDAVACLTTSSTITSTTLGGATGRTYDIRLRFRGVVEEKTYGAGCRSGRFSSGGVPSADTYNLYRLSVSSPPQTYYLNAGASFVTRTWAIDFTQTIPMDAGATVTLFADAIDGTQIRNRDDTGTPISIPGVTPPQPYAGQFIQMDVLSVTPQPLPTTSRGAAGALSFASGQWVSIADAPALHPNSLTLEAWFLQSALGGPYNSILGKGYNATFWDSYTIWFQGNAINAGVVANGQWSQISYPWTPDLGHWHHAAFTYDGTTFDERLYLDGQAVLCSTGLGPIQTDATPLYLGGDVENGSPNGFWIGQLDDVRMYSTVRTDAEIRADMRQHQLGPQPGLIGEWCFDEMVGQHTSDTSGGGLHGVLGANTSTDATDPTRIGSTLP
ncbi:MAG: LamG domain-containing protein [Myxococcota bacterium]